MQTKADQTSNPTRANHCHCLEQLNNSVASQSSSRCCCFCLAVQLEPTSANQRQPASWPVASLAARIAGYYYNNRRLLSRSSDFARPVFGRLLVDTKEQTSDGPSSSPLKAKNGCQCSCWLKSDRIGQQAIVSAAAVAVVVVLKSVPTESSQSTTSQIGLRAT